MTRRLIYHPLLLICLFLAGIAPPSFSQVGAKIAIDSTSVLVGGKRQVRLSVNYAPGIRLLAPGIALVDTAEAIELLSSTPWDTVSRDDRSILIQKDLIITAWDSGFFTIPAIPVPYEIQGRTDTAFTNTLALQAGLAPADTLAIQPIKPILEEPARIEDFIPYLTGLFAVFALVALFWWYRKRKKQQPAPPPPPPVEIPPHLLALGKLEALEKARLWEKGQIVAYHTQLTYILREYLEQRFHILALESTTREITLQLKNLVTEDLEQEITQLLMTSDMVKFAKAEPPKEVHQQLLDQTRHFIRTTQQPDNA